jgi:hypothetical protein
MIEAIWALDSSPVVKARPVEKRLIGNCRQFSTLSTALLRSKGIPARARCGFANYFEKDRYVDHWIVEWWDTQKKRWIQTDTQLDDVLREGLGIQFDSEDLPPRVFLNAGRAWQLCRNGNEDPERFGIFDMWGLWFIRGNVVRDLASLNKIELLPWDGWGVLLDDFDESDVQGMNRIDEAAAVAAAGDFDSAIEMYEVDELKVPGWVIAWAEGGGKRVELPQLSS